MDGGEGLKLSFAGNGGSGERVYVCIYSNQLKKSNCHIVEDPARI